MRQLSLLAAAAVAVLGAAPARANTVIDTTGIGGSSFTCLGTYIQCGQTFGETFTAPAVDTFLTSFGFNLTPVSGPLNVELVVYGWSGSARTGSPLYTSPSVTLTSVDTSVSFAPNINLTPGSQYIAYLDTAGQGNSTSVNSGMFAISDGSYTGGTFIWERTSGDGIWNDTGSDVQFRAVFTAGSAAVPEPASLALLALGLGGLAAARRRP